MRKTERYTNIDILRTLCAISVVFEHFCEVSNHNGFGYALETSYLSYVILKVLYTAARTAVPIFFILSGYLSVHSEKQRIDKVCGLFALVQFCGYFQYLGNYVISRALHEETALSVKNLIILLLPSNYYLYLFSALYILSPYINKGVKLLSKKQFQKLLCVMVCLFQIWSFMMNMLGAMLSEGEITNVYFTNISGSSMGFNIVNFLTLYLIGAYIRLHVSIKQPGKMRCYTAAIALFTTILSTICGLAFSRFSSVLLNYDSIPIVLSAIAIVCFWLSVPIRKQSVFNITGKLTFHTFIIHGFASAIIERFVTIEHVVFSYGMISAVVIFVLGTYLLSLLLSFLIQVITLPISRLWRKSRLANLPIY